MTDYGTDLNFYDLDLAGDAGTVSGYALLLQSVLLRLSTPTGSVIDAPNDGLDLRAFVSRALDPSDLAALRGLIESEILKDERFVGAVANVDASKVTTTGELAVSLELDAGAGPFSLTLSVSAAAVAMVGGAQ